MPSNYDEVVKKNKQYLTSAQINALAAASKEYNISNAGRRAEAQATLRDQYDAGYRGLQNMGLAGAVGGQPTSGEVPRLEQQIKTPFNNYNQKLQQVENQRLSALGANYAAQTQAARAAAAAAAAERARIAAAEAESQRRGERYFEPRQQQSTSDSFIGPPTRQQWQEQQNRQNQYMNQLQAAASVLGVPTPNLPTQIKQTNATGAAKNNIVSAARDAATKNPATAFKTAPDAMKQQHTEMRQAESVLSTGKGYDTAADKNALAQAEKQLENLKWTRHYGGRSAVSDADFNAAQAAVDAARLKVEQPQVYAAFVIKNSPTASAADKSKATGIVASYKSEEMTEALGYSKPTMTDTEFQDNAKIVPDVRRYLDIIDSQRIAQENKRKTGTTGSVDYEQRDIDDALAELEKLHFTEEQARRFISDFDNNRSAKRDYDTFYDAFRSFYEHQGERPTKGLNNNETDPTYRAVNNMPDLAVMDYNSRALDNPQLGPIDKLWTPQEQALGNVDYMTKEQRDAYNAIYEKDGIAAANKYANAIKPLVEMKRAADDDKFLKKLAKEHGVQAWALARATNLISNVPAMAEKLVTGAANLANDIATGGTNVPIRYSPDSAMSRASNWADIIQSEQSRTILQHYDEIGRPGLGKIVNFGYSTGTSMADSGIAMLISGMGASWLTDVLFLSSAGNSAYKDAIERGGTQEQALAFSVLSGTAEALFEHVSIEHFLNDLQFSGPKAVQLIKSMLSQGGTEASEEVCTEIANILSDVWVMGDKSEFEQLKQQPGGERGAYMALLKNAGSAALGGLASGLGFGAISMLRSAPGRILQRAEINDIGDQVIKSKGVQNLVDTARLLGGEASSLADKVSKKETNANVGDLAVKVGEMQRELYKNEQNGVPRSNEHAQDREVMVTRLLDGGKMDAFEAKDIMDTIGADSLSKLGYDVSSPRAFKNSYNAILQKYGIDSKAERMSSVGGNLFSSRTGSATYVQTHPTGLGMQRSGEAAAQYRSRQAAANYTGARNSAAMNVWANPQQGMALTMNNGTQVPIMPGNMTAVAMAEQERTNFQTRSTATKGRVTYAVAGMEARKGLTNEQTYSEIQKGLTKEARKKAQVYEKLADALGVNMVIHDVMTGTNGFIDEKGNMHVVLSGKQSVLRVAAHELTHWMKEHNDTGYASMREHLIKDVGQERFDRMLKQKAREYGIDMSTEKGRTLADDEVCAELCERMLSDTDALERFAEKDTEAAKTLKEHLLKILNAIKRALKDVGNRDFGSSWSDLVHEQETIESWISNLQTAIENADQRASTSEGVIGKVAGTTSSDLNETISDIKEANTVEEMDDAIAEHSVDVIAYDMAGYMDDLKNAKVMSASELKELMRTMNAAIDKVKAHRAILDFGAELNTEEEILAAKEGRAYFPYKQNADPHYKLALDFSTLCRKRTLLQTIQERLQAKMGRATTQEETVAIRLELQKLQRQGYHVEVACALCYVEAARLKSPKVINTFLNNTANEMRNYFAKKNPASKKIIEGLQQQWKVDHGLEPTATKQDMKAEGVSVDAYNNYSRELREQFESDNAAEKVTIDRAVGLASNERVMIGGIEFPGRETFLSASWLTKLKSVEPDIFNAFTDKVRSATRSKAQETDTFYSRGDIDMVTEAILKYANAESGFRHQSWSDFVPTHLLDTMAAVIEMSTRDAKMHAYTKVPAMVRLLGKTGMALNMSLIPSGNTGIDANGNLVFDSVEGMPWETMMELRDMFPDTAGNIAIGINDEQIQKMLASKDIDYVIPYHASGMNKNMRGYLDIRAWSEYTSSQNEKSNHRGTKGTAPELAEWFDEKAASNAADGEAFMREASEKYLALCYERNLVPKFSQYLTNNGDGSYSLKEGYENYWKMLTDRKMVNQKTGKVIIQQAVKPTFDQATVLGILEDRLHDPAIQDAAEAADIVTEKFSDWQANRNNASAEAIQEAKNIRDRTAAITAQKTAEAGGVRNSLDTDYLRLAEKYKSGTATEADTEQLQQEVDQAAQTAGYTIKAWHGSRAIFTEFSSEKRGANTGTKASEQWFFAGDFDTANSYYPAGVMRELMKQYPAMYSQKDIDSMERRGVAGKLYPLYLKMENPLIVDVAGYDYASHKQSKDAMMEYVEQANREGRDGIILLNARDNNLNPSAENSTVYMFRSSSQAKLADPVTYDNKGNIIPLSERFNQSSNDIRYDLDTDTIREAFTHIDTSALDKGLESLRNVTPGKGLWAIKDISRFLDSIAGGNKDLRDTLTDIFETPHRQSLKNYATGVGEMQKRVLEIGAKAGVCDSKGKHFDSKKSAAIQNIGEGFSNKHTDVSVRVVDADAVRVTATDKETGKALGTKDYTFRELRGAYGHEVADQLWSEAFDAAQKAGKPADVEREVNTQPYTLDDLKAAYPQDWQKLKTAADEFRTMYDEYIRDINNMLETIYPNASKYATVDKITEAIEKKQQRLADRKAAYAVQIENLQSSLVVKEMEAAKKKNKDTKAYRQLVDQANQIRSKMAEALAEIEEYEENVKDELEVMGEEKTLMQNAEHEGDSLGRMHRLEYRSDYFHHFTEMTSGVQNLKSIFTGNTDISPAVVGKSDQTKAKSRFAGFFQKRKGGDYTADALNGMLRYGQLAEYKLAFDPFAAYLRDVEKQVANLDKNKTNRNNLIRYIQQWTNTILGKSHTIDRAMVDSGIGMRSKLYKVLSWINSRVIQNTLLWNMRSALIQISNVTNAKGIVTNNLDWANGLRKWALAARGNREMQAIMNQSTFLASRYMDNLQLTDSVFKSAKNFAGWMLGALDEVSAKATWWAAYTQYQRNPNAKVIKNAYRTYDNAIDYADDVTRRTHAGRGVGELAPAMTSRVISLVAPFQVEVNNTYQLLKDNVKQKNVLGLISTGVSVFVLNTIFEAIVGSTPLGFDFIRAIIDIAFGIAGDDPDDDKDDYDVKRVAQRIAGEFVGGLPYANQIVGLIGKDNAEKILGSDTDVTRYENTQIGLNAMMNTIAGISDIGSAVKEGKNLFTETNFISDIDDLLNIIMPMGAKQMTRTAEGLMTVAKGYGSKADKEGNEKVQFVADQDLVNWLHAGLFGKWSLTEASEYFGEKRFLPQLFGKYDGPKSSIGKTVDAKEYKAALETGINGHQYFDLKYDLSEYSTAGGKREEMMNQKLTADQKARLDFLLITSHGAGTKVENGVLYKQDEDGTWKQSAKAAGGILYGVNSKGDWEVKTDYTSRDMYDLSVMGSKIYGATKGLIAGGFDSDKALTAARVWYDTKDTPDEIEGVDDRKLAFRRMLFDSNAYTAAQKQQLDAAYCETKHQADYTDKELFELSTGGNYSRYEKAAEAKKLGVPVATYEKLADKKAELTEKNKQNNDGEAVSKAMRREIMDSNLTAKQKEALDDLLVSDKGQNPDYSSPTWFEISMLGGGQYKEAKDGEKVGLKPETYLTVYKKWKTLDAKDENGNTRSGLKKKRAKAYLDSLPISAPVYDYIWMSVFGYKSR